ncbi:MAG: ComEC/Rec2 family competence protein [Oscillospiraceae bacterium]|jgi:competence protein ComEC
MKRPLALVGFTYLLAQVAAVFLKNYSLTAGLSIGCFLSFFILMRIPFCRKTYCFPVAFLTAAVAFTIFTVSDWNISSIKSFDDREVTVTGTVMETPELSNEKFYYIVKVDSCEGTDTDELIGKTIRLSSKQALGAESFDTLTCRVHFYPTSDSFSSWSKRISLEGYIFEYMPFSYETPKNYPLTAFPMKLREQLLSNIWDYLSKKAAGLGGALLLGDKVSLSQQIVDDFRLAGVIHLMSVSGFHMGIMTQLFFFLLTFVPISHRRKNLFAVFGIWLFMAVTAFTPSVLRSGIMYLIMLIGRFFYRRADSLNSLGFAVFLICLMDPFSAADPGFLLSVSATLGILIFASPLIKCFLRHWPEKMRSNKFLKNFSEILSITVSSMLFTLPVILIYFHTFTPASILSNFCLLWPVALFLYTVAGTAVLGGIPGVKILAVPFSWAAEHLADGILKTVHWIASLPYASISVSEEFSQFFLVCVFLLFGITFLCFCSKKNLQAAGILSVCILFAGIFGCQLESYNATWVTFVGGGKGTSLIFTKNGKSAVIGCNTKSRLIDYALREQNTKEVCFLTYLTKKPSEEWAASDLILKWKPDHVLLQPATYLEDSIRLALPNAGRTHTFGTASQIELWDQIRITVVPGAALANIDGTKFLICSKGTSLDSLPESFQNADFYFGVDLPKSSKPFQPNNIFLNHFLSSSLKKSSAKLNVPVYITDGNGSFVLEMKPDNTIKIRRSA